MSDSKRRVQLRRYLIWGSIFFSSILFAANQSVVQLNPSQSKFTITLPANPTTGFQWTVQSYDKTLFCLINSEYNLPKTKLIGAGGQMVFTFKKLKRKTYPKSSKIQFKYARSWEPKSGNLKEVTVQMP